MRVYETDPAIAAKNREQGGRALLFGGCLFAVGMVLVVLSGSVDLAIIPVIGLCIAAVGRMVVESNRSA